MHKSGPPSISWPTLYSMNTVFKIIFFIFQAAIFHSEGKISHTFRDTSCFVAANVNCKQTRKNVSLPLTFHTETKIPKATKLLKLQSLQIWCCAEKHLPLKWYSCPTFCGHCTKKAYVPSVRKPDAPLVCPISQSDSQTAYCISYLVSA